MKRSPPQPHTKPQTLMWQSNTGGLRGWVTARDSHPGGYCPVFFRQRGSGFPWELLSLTCFWGNMKHKHEGAASISGQKGSWQSELNQANTESGIFIPVFVRICLHLVLVTASGSLQKDTSPSQWRHSHTLKRLLSGCGCKGTAHSCFCCEEHRTVMPSLSPSWLCPWGTKQTLGEPEDNFSSDQGDWGQDTGAQIVP